VIGISLEGKFLVSLLKIYFIKAAEGLSKLLTDGLLFNLISSSAARNAFKQTFCPFHG
jgi:hypothetical protein